jgi:hypothetical protein
MDGGEIESNIVGEDAEKAACSAMPMMSLMRLERARPRYLLYWARMEALRPIRNAVYPMQNNNRYALP